MAYRQDNFFGMHADADGTVERRFAGVLIGGTMDVRLENPGGLTGVWAEENTRDALWDAMYRKETFGVSGPHIKVRFFGGWGYDKGITAPRLGEAVLRGRRADGRRPAADAGRRQGHGPDVRRLGGEGPDLGQSRPDPGHQGLDAERAELREDLRCRLGRVSANPTKWTGRVPAIRSTVDIDKATYTNDVGSTELKTVWTDPEFDASLHAFYYARVLEIPTPRWTLTQAVQSGLPPPDVVPLTGQERAWSSPI